jgi:hypothetical protein
MDGGVIRRWVAGAAALSAIAFLVAVLDAPSPRVSRTADFAWAIPVSLLIIAGVAAYAARQTLFGSLFHLIFLGVLMGAALGAAGAAVGIRNHTLNH